MPFTVTVINKVAYILVEYEGRLTRDELEGGQLSTAEQLKACGSGKLLIDFAAMHGRGSSEDIYFFAESFKAVLPGVKIGLVVPKKQQWCAEFLERLASNRNLRLAVFARHEAARNWLLDESRTD